MVSFERMPNHPEIAAQAASLASLRERLDGIVRQGITPEDAELALMAICFLLNLLAVWGLIPKERPEGQNDSPGNKSG